MSETTQPLHEFYAATNLLLILPHTRLISLFSLFVCKQATHTHTVIVELSRNCWWTFFFSMYLFILCPTICKTNQPAFIYIYHNTPHKRCVNHRTITVCLVVLFSFTAGDIRVSGVNVRTASTQRCSDQFTTETHFCLIYSFTAV